MHQNFYRSALLSLVTVVLPKVVVWEEQLSVMDIPTQYPRR
jgi:hypothetical protein